MLRLKHLTPLGALLLLGASPTPTPTPINLGNTSSIATPWPYSSPTPSPLLTTLTCYNQTHSQVCQPDPTDVISLLVSNGDTLLLTIAANNGSPLPASMTFNIMGQLLTFPTPPQGATITVDAVGIYTFTLATPGYFCEPLIIRAQ